MKRRSRAGGRPIKGPRRKTPEPKSRNAPKAPAAFNASSAVEETKVARLTHELREALEQQSATSEVLRAISSYPGDPQPVFHAMLKNAVRLCDAEFGNIYHWDGNALHLVATHNAPPAFAEARRLTTGRPGPKTPTRRVIANKKVVHIADLRAEKAYADRDPWIVAGVELGGVRTVLMVPMLKENELIGAFSVYRQKVQPFSDKQIELSRNFAAQAVIAIENTRLLNELRQRTTDLSQRTTDLTEALEQQTATSEVLQVISSSPGDLEPVFATMLKEAVRICDAKSGGIYRVKGDAMRLVATHNVPPPYAEARRFSPFHPGPKHILGRVMRTKSVVQIADAATDPGYVERRPEMVAAVELGGVGTMLGVPMLKENDLAGVFALNRQEVRPFTDKQIELVKNFAAQAIIAIENARLLNELRQRTTDLAEALEQQTATSEVLQVISGSPGDLQPVFAAMLENAARICEANFGNIFRWDGEALHLIAIHNTPPAFAEYRRRRPLPLKPNLPFARMVAEKAVVHCANAAALPAYTDQHDPEVTAAVELGGIRTFLAVPMLKEDQLIGALIVYRQEVRPFTDKQIELVKNFAAQAVIAIENARLLDELRQRTADLSQRTTDLTEALEQQTATSEVLQVISSSPGDLEPVFATMLENAVRICDATFGNIYRWDGQLSNLVASHNTPPALVEARRRLRMHFGPKDLVGQATANRKAIHIADLAEHQDYLERSNEGMIAAVELGGVRTHVVVPMLKDDELIGTFHLSRQEVRPFTDKQIKLVTNFAAQAVIAIENARLLNELRQRTTDLTERTADLTEALAQQTATSDVLQVISSSPGDLEPVFTTMLENATRICDAKFGNVYLWDGGVLV